MTSIESLKKQAKKWLKDLRAGDTAARARLASAHPSAPVEPGLRDVQHALARERGFSGWAALVVAATDDGSREAAVRALLEAAARGDTVQVDQLLARHPDIVNERRVLAGHTGLRTALHYAMRGPHVDVIASLLVHGANPNVRDEGDAATPLHFAAEKQRLDVIRLLVEHGADPNGDGDSHELGVLGWATAFDYVQPNREVVDYLLAHGARHTIFTAVALGEVAAIRAFPRADLDRRMDLTNRRRMPLHLAVTKRQPAAISALLELGADPECVDERGLTPLDQAALEGQRELARILISHGAAVRLPAAVALDRSRDVERLLRDEPESLVPGRRWSQLIAAASYVASGAVIEQLIHHGADPNVYEDPKTAVDAAPHFTPLHAAAWAGNAEAVAALLAHGANVAAREEKYAGTPAGWATHAGHLVVRDAILAGAIDLFEAIDFDLVDRIPSIVAGDPTARERPFHTYVVPQPRANAWWPPPDCTPLAWAERRGKPDAARVLREQGARR